MNMSNKGKRIRREDDKIFYTVEDREWVKGHRKRIGWRDGLEENGGSNAEL